MRKSVIKIFLENTSARIRQENWWRAINRKEKESRKSMGVVDQAGLEISASADQFNWHYGSSRGWQATCVHAFARLDTIDAQQDTTRKEKRKEIPPVVLANIGPDLWAHLGGKPHGVPRYRSADAADYAAFLAICAIACVRACVRSHTSLTRDYLIALSNEELTDAKIRSQIGWKSVDNGGEEKWVSRFMNKWFSLVLFRKNRNNEWWIIVVRSCFYLARSRCMYPLHFHDIT